MPVLHQVQAYILHKLYAINEFSLHSPFLYDFYIQCFRNSLECCPDNEIEKLRKKLRKNHSGIPIIDRGAGSKLSPTTNRPISSIAKKGLTPARFSILIQNIIRYLDFKEILELGTSFGINSLYMSRAHSGTHVTTMEGCPSIAKIAKSNFKLFNNANIDLIEGNIDEELSQFLETANKIDFVYIDANHTYQSTINYYKQLIPHLSNKAMVVIDDIYWSTEMTNAWKQIVKDSAGTIYIDIFQSGLILFNDQLPPGQYRFEY